MQKQRNMIYVPTQIVEITKITKTKGDQEEIILPESDQEHYPIFNPQNDYNIRQCDQKTKKKKKHIRFSFQNRVSSRQLNSKHNSPTNSPRKSSYSIQSILKPQCLSMFYQSKK
ncbi:unnamed protein product [Paramecium pentaurelia]|uniref:Uncharacterized protein n=1 Tax=Paramecium pentaurelia TaxID=43138 RepID=A0A8S1VXI3_9CILI|nr:unnamed protein product [Paramecium pentaurelia]